MVSIFQQVCVLLHMQGRVLCTLRIRNVRGVDEELFLQVLGDRRKHIFAKAEILWTVWQYFGRTDVTTMLSVLRCNTHKRTASTASRTR